MSKSILILDTSYLAYRNFYAMGNLSFEDVPTGVAYGVLRDIQELTDRFAPTVFAFCFDVGKPIRCNLYPEYKQKRRQEETPEQQEARRLVRQQITTLREETLPALGYQNLAHQVGYEADDLIASICNCYPRVEKIIVGCDGDLFQLLGQHTSIWNPTKKKIISQQSFEREWGIDPKLWSMVKAIAGCSSDNIQGVAGVGEKTAVKFLRGDLTKGKVFERIVTSRADWEQNIRLVRLPLKGTMKVRLRKDETNPRKWRSVKRKLGINSI